MFSDWFSAPASSYPAAAISVVFVYLAIIVLTRIVGLRSLSKMSAPDFVMTVAVGSLMATSISTASPQLPLALFVLALVFGGQWAIAWARRAWPSTSEVIDNTPVLLMQGQTFLRENMAKTNITEADIRGKLREANVLGLDQVRAVVFETTGDISVLHTSNPDRELDAGMLLGVRRRLGPVSGPESA